MVDDTTIYYPHFDLEKKGLIGEATDHILNIKLLILLANRVLILPSHLLDTSFSRIVMLHSYLQEFINDGKIITSIYQSHSNVEEYLDQKIEEAIDDAIKKQYIYKTNYMLHQLLINTTVIKRDNEQEKGLFQTAYNDANIQQARLTSNNKLKHTATKFYDEFYERSERSGLLLTVQDVNQMIKDLVRDKKIYKSHIPFLQRNLIGSYYYCGSLANSAVTAYNPYFVEINYDKVSEGIPHKSSNAYNPEFLYQVLKGLKIINSPKDIYMLTSKDIDIIRNHKVWSEFVDMFVQLYGDTGTLQTLINTEFDKQRRYDRVKSMVFSITNGIFDFMLGDIIGLLLAGYWAFAVGLLFTLLGSVFGETRVHTKLKCKSTDAIIDGLIHSKEPMYVFTTRIRKQLEYEIQRTH